VGHRSLARSPRQGGATYPLLTCLLALLDDALDLLLEGLYGLLRGVSPERAALNPAASSRETSE
jgi:hypothetical protein